MTYLSLALGINIDTKIKQLNYNLKLSLCYSITVVFLLKLKVIKYFAIVRCLTEKNNPRKAEYFLSGRPAFIKITAGKRESHVVPINRDSLKPFRF